MDASITEDHGLEEALSVMKRVASGDFEARLTNITAGGEMGELMHAATSRSWRAGL